MPRFLFRRRSDRSRRACAAAFALLVAGAASAGAQTRPAPPPASSAAPGSGTSATTLRVSMEQAVAMALETNLGLKQERINVDLASEAVAGARSAFLPLASSSFSHNNTAAPAQVLPDGTTAVASSTTFSGGGGLSQRLPWLGGGYTVTWSANRNATGGGAASTFNPRLGSTLHVNFAQPLLKGLATDSTRTTLRTTEQQRVIADLSLQERIVTTETSVRDAYLSLLAAIETQKVAQENMQLAEESLRDSQSRVAVGQAPQIDIITAQASVESNREQLILAVAGIATAEDGLRILTLDPSSADYWQAHLEPTDAIQLSPRAIDLDAAIRSALDQRLDLATLKRGIDITNLNLSLNRDLTRPEVDLTVDYLAAGTGGTQTINGTPAIRPFSTVLGDAFGGTYPSWTAGVNVTYPLGRSGAKAALAQSELTKRQQELSLQALQLNIVSQVRQAARDVDTSYQRVQATQAARAASERQLNAEERRFAVGLSDTFQLQSRQGQLAAARVSDLNAVISYNRALIEFDRVQKIP